MPEGFCLEKKDYLFFLLAAFLLGAAFLFLGAAFFLLGAAFLFLGAAFRFFAAIVFKNLNLKLLNYFDLKIISNYFIKLSYYQE